MAIQSLLIKGGVMMLVLELELIEEMIVSLFLMFFAVAISLVLTKLRTYLTRKTAIPQGNSISPTLTKTSFLPQFLGPSL